MPHLKDVESVIVNLPSAQDPPDLDAFTHVILTGSESSILRPEPWFRTEVELVREAAARGIPILGSCFGHQMLVYALSGPGFVQACRTPEIGWADVEMTRSDPLFDSLPNPWRTFVYHFDEVVAAPAPWVCLGRTPQCDVHLLRYGERTVWGIQAHPEISSRKAKFFMRATLLTSRRPTKHIVHALRHVPERNDVADRIVRNFLDQRPTHR